MSFVSGISTYTAAKFVRRKMDHNLSEYETTSVHPSLSETLKRIVDDHLPPPDFQIENAYTSS
jgi:hypothetical protein